MRIRFLSLAALCLTAAAVAGCGDDADSYAEKGAAEIQDFVAKQKLSWGEGAKLQAGMLAQEDGDELPWADQVTEKGKAKERFAFKVDPRRHHIIAAFHASTAIGCRLIQKLNPPADEVRANPGVGVIGAMTADQLDSVCAGDTVQWWVITFNRTNA